MQGTPKQVAWATDIRKAMMATIEPELQRWAKKLADKPAELDRLQALREFLDAKPATWWIERRDVYPLDAMRQAVAEVLASTTPSTTNEQAMITIYVYSNETGKQVDAIEGADNKACEAVFEDKWGSNDYHASYVDVAVSNAVEKE